MKDRIIALVKEAADVETIDESTRFDALDIDSLEYVELMQKVEEATGIQISDDDASRLTTVAELIRYVENRLPINDYVSS